MNSLQKLLDFLCQLDANKIRFTLKHIRDETIMVFISVPGERWEVEFFADGDIEVEVFKSEGDILSGTDASAALDRLLAIHGD